MKLYEIDEKILNLMRLYENEEIDLDTYIDTMSSLEFEQNKKIDNIACYIKQLVAEEKALKEEIDNLTKRRKTKQKAIKNLKDYVAYSMITNGTDRIETSRNIVSFRNNAEKVVIDDEEEFLKYAMEYHEEWLNYKKPDINKTVLKEYLKNDGIYGVSLIREKTIQIK